MNRESGGRPSIYVDCGGHIYATLWRPHTEIHFPGTTLPVVASCTPSIIDTEEAIAVFFLCASFMECLKQRRKLQL